MLFVLLDASINQRLKYRSWARTEVSFLQPTMDDNSMDKKSASVTFALFCYFFWQRIIPYSLLYVTLYAVDVCEITVETSLPQQYPQPPVFLCLLSSLHPRSHAEGHMDIFCTHRSCTDDQIVILPLSAKTWAKGQKKDNFQAETQVSSWCLLIPAAQCLPLSLTGICWFIGFI